MTSLSSVTLGGHNVTSYAVEFEIRRKLWYPTNIKLKMIRNALDAVHEPVIGDSLTIVYVDSVGTYPIFNGEITKVVPKDWYYILEATTGLVKLFNYYTLYEWTGTINHEDIIADLIDSTAGPGLTVYADSVSVSNSFTYYCAYQQSCIDLIRKLCNASADGAGEKMTVIVQDDGGSDYIRMEDLGEYVPSVDITLSHANGALMSRVVKDDTSQEIVNKVVAKCRHRTVERTESDAGLGTASYNEYGRRIKKIYLPEVLNDTMANYFIDTILRTYAFGNIRFTVDVRHEALHGNATHYPVLNTIYTVVDAPTGETYTDYPCIAQTLRWPSFRDTLTFGTPAYTDGMNDFLLSTNGNQNTVEQTSSNYSPYIFWGYKSNSQTIEGTPEELVIGGEYYDIGSGFSTTYGRYTAPESGIYYIQYYSTISNIANNKTYSTDLMKGGSVTLIYTDTQNTTGSNANISSSGSWTGTLSKGEYVSLFVGHDDTVSRSTTADQYGNYLRGKMISFV